MRQRDSLLRQQKIKRVALPVEQIRSAAYGSFGEKKIIRDVPYVPTPQWVVREMLTLASVGPGDIVYDPGCGDGRIIVTAAKEFGAHGVGIDIDPDRIAESKKNADIASVWDRTQFHQMSLFDVDFRPATVVTLYLLPWANARLRPKFLAELRPGSRIVGHSFGMQNWLPDRTINLPYEERTIRRWIVPANVAGRWSCTLRVPNGRLKHGLLELEQEFQTIVGQIVIDGEALPLQRIALQGPRLVFQIKGADYICHVDADSIHGASKCREHPTWTMELRARRM